MKVDDVLDWLRHFVKGARKVEKKKQTKPYLTVTVPPTSDDSFRSPMQQYILSSFVWPPEPREPEPLPQRQSTEPIRAYRMWRLERSGTDFRLRSVTMDDLWEGPILRADAKPDERMATTWRIYPSPAGQTPHFGIFAYRLCAGALRCRDDRNQLHFHGHGGPYVEGEVDLLGRVVVHEAGYRAEMARVVRLYVANAPTEWYRDGLLAALEARYQCPVSAVVDPDWDNLRADQPDDVKPPRIKVVSPKSKTWKRLEARNGNR